MCVWGGGGRGLVAGVATGVHQQGGGQSSSGVAEDLVLAREKKGCSKKGVGSWGGNQLLGKDGRAAKDFQAGGWKGCAHARGTLAPVQEGDDGGFSVRGVLNGVALMVVAITGDGVGVAVAMVRLDQHVLQRIVGCLCTVRAPGSGCRSN